MLNFENENIDTEGVDYVGPEHSPECVENEECFNIDNKILMYGGAGVGVAGIAVYLISRWNKKRKAKLADIEEKELATKAKASEEAKKVNTEVEPKTECSNTSCHNEAYRNGICKECELKCAEQSKNMMLETMLEKILEELKGVKESQEKDREKITFLKDTLLVNWDSSKVDRLEKSIDSLAIKLSQLENRFAPGNKSNPRK